MKAINTENAPKAIGPYSQAIIAGDFVFVSGQLPIDPKTGIISSLEIKTQVKQVITNIEEILKAADLTLESIVKCEIFVKDLNDFKLINEAYSTFFKGPNFPARFTVQVARLPLDALVEISCIAHKGNG